MKVLHMVAFVLLVIGGLNWGIVALGFNPVNMILGSIPLLERAVYALVGISAVFIAVTHKNDCKACIVGSAPM